MSHLFSQTATDYILAISFTSERTMEIKKSLEKSKNVLEKRKIVKRKICIKKTHAFTIIAMNFAHNFFGRGRRPENAWAFVVIW